MTLPEKELIVSRIIAGCFIVEIEDNLGIPILLLLKTPSRLQRYMAEQVFKDALFRAELDGSYTEKEHMDFLYDKGLWDDKKQTKLDQCNGKVEDLKVELFESVFQSQKKIKIRDALIRTRIEQRNLILQLHEYDYLSAFGVAGMTKARYLLAASLYKINGDKLFNENELWSASDFVIEAVAANISDQKINEGQLRELARTDPWRTVWASRKSEASLFGIPAVDLSEDQKLLSIWSGVYDNIYEHPSCPDDKVVKDDDMLDGWMLVQKRKHDSERGNSAIDEMIKNEKIKGDEEIFLPADTVEDARKISRLNDSASAMLKRKREAIIAQKGTVDEKDMPDSQMKIRMEFSKMYAEQQRTK